MPTLFESERVPSARIKPLELPGWDRTFYLRALWLFRVSFPLGLIVTLLTLLVSSSDGLNGTQRWGAPVPFLTRTCPLHTDGRFTVEAAYFTGDALIWTLPFLPFATLWQSWRIHRTRSRWLHGACLRCGYDLRGLTQRRCPECGTAFEHVLLDGDSPPEIQSTRRGWALLLLLSALAMLIFSMCRLMRV